MNDLLSIITVNYNGLADTIELITSLKTHVHSVEYEIIVVDNASKIDEAKELQLLFPDLRVIRSEKNLGFAGGNNLGIQIARGNYLFFLNNDTYLTEDRLAQFVDVMKQNSEIGMMSPKIKFAEPENTIQFAGYTPLSSITLRNRLIGFGEKDRSQYNQPGEMPFLHGAAMLVRREVIDQVGMMPESYFLYYEELDWCTQILQAGFRLYYAPVCTIYHKESQSTGQNSPLRTYYLTRNRLLYGWRNRTGMTRLLCISYQLWIANPKNMLVLFLKGERENALSVVRGMLDFVKLLN